jgi:hypothetical protein
MRKAGAIIGILASLAVIGFSASINARWGWALGRTQLDSQILAAASVAFDVLKALGLFFIFGAWRDGQPIRACMATVLWTVVLAYSAASAIGFAALNRTDASSGREQAAVHYGDLRAELDRANRELASIVTLRSSDAVATDIGAMQLKPEWNATGGCQQASRPPSWCQTYLHLKSELAEAQHRDSLTAQRDKLIAETAALPPISQGDPQVATLSNFIPLPTGAIGTGLVVLVAVAMEIVSSVGLYVSSAMWSDPQNADPQRAENELFERLSSKIDAISSKIDQLEVEQAEAVEEVVGDDEVAHVSSTEKGKRMAGVVAPVQPRLVPQDGKLIGSSTSAPRKALVTDKPLVENRDPSAKPVFADPALLEKLRSLDGGYEKSLDELARGLNTSIGTLHKKLTQAEAAGRIAWRASRGKGTSIKLIEVH